MLKKTITYQDYFGTTIPKWGNDSDAIYNIQHALYLLGYIVDRKDVCGHFGPNTNKAIRRFQHDHGLKVDSLVGPQTGEALFNATYKKIGGELSNDSRFKTLY